ncbi:hypothetical protein DVDV_2430 [Desulfovibrio sp. DV]|nr:hypothetical protein DVDV_2430 [Desulfovibrio sp. DV]
MAVSFALNASTCPAANAGRHYLQTVTRRPALGKGRGASILSTHGPVTFSRAEQYPFTSAMLLIIGIDFQAGAV